MSAYPDDENAVDESDGNEEDVEGFSEGFIRSAADHEEDDHAHLNEQK